MIILVVYDVRNNFLDNYEGMRKGKKWKDNIASVFNFYFYNFFFFLIFLFINPQY